MAASYPTGRFHVSFAAESHVGRKRAHNEDSFYLPGADRLAVVADGMGGHASGEVASRIAVDTVSGYFKQSEGEPQPTWPFKMGDGGRLTEKRLSCGIKLANARIFETAQANAAQHGMGTTLVAALFQDDGRALIAHVGDSRAYRLRDGALTQLTDDHSLMNDYMRMKGLREGELTDFPQKNVIVRALGMKETVQVDLAREQPRAGDVYVLCSDGLTGMVSDAEIAQTIAAEPDLDAACARLVLLANEHGGVDNITVLLARVSDRPA